MLIDVVIIVILITFGMFAKAISETKGDKE